MREHHIKNLPVHDAELISIRIRTDCKGITESEVVLSIDADEMQALLPFGIRTQRVRLKFGNCLQIISNILCYQTPPEQVYDWRVAAESERLSALQAGGEKSMSGFLHHTFEFSRGSMLEIIAASTFIMTARAVDAEK